MKYSIYLITTVFIFLFNSNAKAVEFLVSIQKKQEDKYKNRWTLASWLEDKRKMRLQDMWLAGNVRQNNYEFFLGAEQTTLNSVDTLPGLKSEFVSTAGSLAAYATIAGLEGKIATDDNDRAITEVQFKLRLLGTSLQNTNIVLGYGIRDTKTNSEQYKSQMGKILITIYITKLFGISGEYTHLFPTETLAGDLDGTELETQVFIDFSFLRIFGSSISGSHTLSTTTDSTETTFTGLKGGIKVFF